MSAVNVGITRQTNPEAQQATRILTCARYLIPYVTSL